MRGPSPVKVELTADEQADLEALVRRHTTPQHLALRGRIVLAAATGATNAQIARQLQVSVPMVRHWRARWMLFSGVPIQELTSADRLADAPCPGSPLQISADQVCLLIRMGCEAPTASGRPITEWTGREIADEAKRRGIVSQISPHHAARLIKRGSSSRTASAVG